MRVSGGLVGVRRLRRRTRTRDRAAASGGARVAELLVDGGGQPGLVGHRRRGELEERALVVVAAQDVRRLGDLAGLVERPRLIGEEVAVDDGGVRSAQASVGLGGVQQRLHRHLAQAGQRVGGAARGRAVRSAARGRAVEPARRWRPQRLRRRGRRRRAHRPRKQRGAGAAKLRGQGEQGRLVAASVGWRVVQPPLSLMARSKRGGVWGDATCMHTSSDPADSPKMVTLLGSPPNLRDVGLHPLQRKALIPQPLVARLRALGDEPRIGEEPEDAEAVVQSHDDHAVPREGRAAVEVAPPSENGTGSEAEPPTLPPP